MPLFGLVNCNAPGPSIRITSQYLYFGLLHTKRQRQLEYRFSSSTSRTQTWTSWPPKHNIFKVCSKFWQKISEFLAPGVTDTADFMSGRLFYIITLVWQTGSVKFCSVLHTVIFLSFRTDRSLQTVQTQIRLIWVYTLCNSLCIFGMHNSKETLSCSTFRVITTIFLGIQIFRKFTVLYLTTVNFQNIWTPKKLL